MLHWNALHPYNAVHVVQVAARLDRARLARTLQAGLARLGLIEVTLDVSRSAFRFAATGEPPEVRWLEAGGDPGAALAAEIPAQLNRRFDPARPFCPFRFFAVPDDSGFLLGLVYFHPVADAESVVHLLHRLVDGYLGSPDADESAPLELYPSTPAGLLRRPALLWRKLGQFPGQLRDLHRSFRAGKKARTDGANGFEFAQLSAPELSAVLATAKAQAVTANDLFLALLMKSLSPLAAGRFRARRRKLSVGCVVNTRRDFGVDGPRTFGLFLGSFLVSHEAPESMSVPVLAREIQRQTARIKRGQLYLGAVFEMAVAGRLLAFCSTERRKKLYQMYYPLWGGITNMNLNPLWPAAATGAGLGYFRAVSTGPMTPLVLAVTTVGEHANLGFTFRTAVFTPAMIATVKARLVQLVRELTATP